MNPPPPKTPAQRYADWFAKNRERVLAYKRQYYASHPEFAERKRQRALERYHAKRGALAVKTNVEAPETFFQAADKDGRLPEA